MLKIFVLETIN